MIKDYQQFNCYEILSISSSASETEIKSAIRKASMTHHPDIVGGGGEAQIKINLAKDVLLNPAKKQAHDKYWISSENKFSDPRKQGQNSTSREKKYSKSNQESTTRNQNKTSTEREKAPPSPNQAPPAHILKSFRDRFVKELKNEENRILGELGYRIHSFEIQYKQIISKERSGAFFLIVSIVLSSYIVNYFGVQWAWLFIVYLSWSLLTKIVGIKLGDNSYSILSFDLQRLNEYANQAAKKSCDKDMADLQKHNAFVEYISTMISRLSTLDDSEVEIACRLVVAFFVKGYVPSYLDRENRIIRFKYGDDYAFVRFRHRSGAPVNIVYVEKLVEQMTLHGVANGFFFSSSGLSSNAKKYAAEHKIKCYSYLDGLNQWVKGAVTSNIGPEGNILRHLNDLKSILDSITYKPESKPSRYYRYKKYR